MRRTLVGAICVLAIASACSSGSGTSASPAGTSGTSPAPSMEASPAESMAASPGASTEASPGTSAAAGGDASAWAQTINGNATLSGWQASPDEGKALQNALDQFATTYPNIKVDYKEVPGDYRTVMQTKFAAQDVPDIFYVNADYAKEWIDQGLLEPLDDYISKSGFDTSTFFPGPMRRMSVLWSPSMSPNRSSSFGIEEVPSSCQAPWPSWRTSNCSPFLAKRSDLPLPSK